MEAESLKGVSQAAPSIDQSYQTEMNYLLSFEYDFDCKYFVKKKIKLTISYNHRQDKEMTRGFDKGNVVFTRASFLVRAELDILKKKDLGKYSILYKTRK